MIRRTSFGQTTVGGPWLGLEGIRQIVRLRLVGEASGETIPDPRHGRSVSFQYPRQFMRIFNLGQFDKMPHLLIR